jgi:DUF1707 SHOCT-like domain
MMPGLEGEMAARAADQGRLRASHADRNRVVDVLKAAFIEGRLTKDELDARLSQTLAARTYAELAVLTADIPPGTKLARPPQPEPQSTRWIAHQAVKAGAVTIGGIALAISAIGIVAGQPAIGMVVAGFIVILAAVASALVGSLVGATLMIESRRRQKQSRGQSPTRPGSGASGDQPSQGPPSSGPFPSRHPGEQYTAEATRIRRPRRRFARQATVMLEARSAVYQAV